MPWLVREALGIAACWGRPLDHEAGDDAVEGGAVVEALLREVREVLHVAGRLVREELQLDLPELGIDDGTRCGLGHGHFLLSRVRSLAVRASEAPSPFCCKGFRGPTFLLTFDAPQP